MHMQIWLACLIIVGILLPVDFVLRAYARHEYGLFKSGNRQGDIRDGRRLLEIDPLVAMLLCVEGAISNLALLGAIIGIPLAIFWGI